MVFLSLSYKSRYSTWNRIFFSINIIITPSAIIILLLSYYVQLEILLIIYSCCNYTQFPDVCVNQPINYTFIIETNETDAGIIILEGPYFHIGPGLVPHCVNGVQQQRNYSIFVQVNSIAGSSESDKLYFGKH